MPPRACTPRSSAPLSQHHPCTERSEHLSDRKRHVCGLASAPVVSSLVSFACVRLRPLVYDSMPEMQVTDASDIRRTIIPNPESRKVSGSIPHLGAELW